MNASHWFCLLGLFAPLASAQIYTWTDANGQVHYSDKPVAGAQAITPKSATNIMLSATPTNNKAASQSAPSYQLQFLTPENGATIRNSLGQVPFSLQLHPELQGDQRLQLLLDGQVVRTLGNSGSFILEQVERGEHQLQARVIDKNGKVLASTSSITIYFHHHSRLFPTGSS
ncbi:MAG: DUF4124 domain-containing protein [Ferrimonas sp.]